VNENYIFYVATYILSDGRAKIKFATHRLEWMMLRTAVKHSDVHGN
jgi:hypothetical protein